MGKTKGHQDDGKTKGHQDDGKTKGHQDDGKTKGHQDDGKTKGHHNDGKTKDHNKQGTVYCLKPVPPPYGAIKEIVSDHCEINTIIHYSCQNGYVMSGSSWNQCVYDQSRAVWAYAVPVCKQNVYG